MKYYCIENGCALPDVSQRPNFCPKCGAAQSSEAKAKKKKVVIEEVEEEEIEDEEDEDDTPLPTNIRVSIEGVEPAVTTIGNTINQTKASEKIYRSSVDLAKIQARAKSGKPIEIGG